MAFLLTLVLAQSVPCPPGWTSLEVGACLLPGSGPGVVAYLHGMLPPTTQAFHRELGSVTPAAKRSGTTVIALRGLAGLCDWAEDVKTWWCWPTSRSRVTEIQRTLDRLQAALGEAGARLDRPLADPLIAGYSNGGYFTSLLLERASVPATGFAVLHGGLVTGVEPAERPRPVLLLAAEGDTIQRPAMELFRAVLERRQWVPAFQLRTKAHPLEPEDFDRLMAFAQRLSWRRRPP